MRTELNQLLRKRIGIPQDETIHFEMLDQVLEKTAITIPFENTNIIFGNSYKISKESLINKILLKNEGGLCYELNPIFYFFLLENGFNVKLVRGTVYNQQPQRWSPTERTHTAILLTHNNQNYLIDTGFGVNLPLKPVPLTGQITKSVNGEFRIVPVVNKLGDYILEIKVRNKDSDWKIGYCFDSKKPINDISILNDIQQIISVHPDSSFNKQPLITMHINNGHIILTDSSFTQYMMGETIKDVIDEKTFKEIAKNHFSLNL
ncbi:MAG: arylamine N-acetyltransferase [Bacillota bacterium]|nr:arylamine N-acetyltransferase [Bacillota bacterium]